MPAIASACVQRSPAQLVDDTTLVGTGELVEVDGAGTVGVVLVEDVVLVVEVIDEDVVDDEVVEDVVVDDVVRTVPAPAILI
ncbi:MAG TPA: hypothetical protein VGV86_10820 [Acidimicrobiales bacterium]|nr:hypothetical protein [Acidimicrobiales bacterium]